MERTNQSDDDLKMEMTALVRSKFTPPYLDNEQRKGIDVLIYEIWQELKNRKSPKKEFVIKE